MLRFNAMHTRESQSWVLQEHGFWQSANAYSGTIGFLADSEPWKFSIPAYC